MRSDSVSRFNTQPPEGGWSPDLVAEFNLSGFNTQPPEGGWLILVLVIMTLHSKFQHTAARRRLAVLLAKRSGRRPVSTHSRPKAAGMDTVKSLAPELMFQHTAARRRLGFWVFLHSFLTTVSTHSRPKAAGFRAIRQAVHSNSFNTQPPEGGWLFRQNR